MTDIQLLEYKWCKEQHPGAILLLRCGDFYEAFNEDAKILGKVLGVKIINGTMAGFSYKAIDTYLPKLIRAGHRVVIAAGL